MITKSWFSRYWQWQIGGCVALVGTLSAGVSERVLAQIVPDNTLGAESSVVTPNVNIQGIPSERIDGGATRGANLFHSFQDFNVGEGRGAYFANPTGIENILTRVTGSNASNIFGRLGVLGGANLFLLNPNGIAFGANASLDIQGSFVATTAERIQLGDSGYFSAFEPQTSSLLSVSPGALFFSQVANQPTAIINQGNLSTGKHLTLSAGKLDLQGQLQAGGDLTLQAQDTVRVRDSAAIPFIASAGGNLLVQGNHRVDIFALSHPESGLFSGGDMVLRSANTVGGDAHYWSGGSFRIEQLDGSLGDLSSPHDPIFRARGNVFINSYQGASLHILAGGKVEIPGSVSIQGADPENSLVETVNLADGTTVSINGKSEPTLDIRAGVNPDVIGEQILAVTGTGTFIPPAYATSNQSSADIRIGTILFADAASQPLAGRVLLTNQYQPNSSLSGDIQVTQTLQEGQGAISMDGGAGNPSVAINSRGSITLDGTVNTSSSSGDGGAITLNAAQGSITTGNLNSFSDSSVNRSSNSGGDGGAITLNAAQGSITTGNLNSSSYYRYSNLRRKGGAISLSASNGSIKTGDLLSWSNAFGDVGNGGNISLSASNGSINTGRLDSGSYNRRAGDTGNGGAISLSATDGSINTGYLNSGTRSIDGSAKNGGNISLSASNGSINTGDLSSSTYSPMLGSVENGGNISLSASNGSITTGNLNSGSRAAANNSEGNGGNISLSTSNGSINTGYLNSESSSLGGSTENGGNISLVATNGSINTGGLTSSSSSSYFSGNGTAGNGGAISLHATNNINITGDLNSSSFSYIYPAGNGGAISLDATNGRITISPDRDSSDNESPPSINASGDSGGNITLTSPAGIFELKDGLISSNAIANGSGGNIQIAAASVSLTNTELTTTTRGMGNAGSISITADGLVELDKSRLFTSLEPGGIGRGGDITIDADAVSLTNFSFIDTATFGEGNAGNASLKVDDFVSLDNTSAIFSITAGQGDGGNVNVKAGGAVSLTNRSNISTAVDERAEGNGGNIEITARSLSLTGGSQLVTSTSSSGNAGKITVNTTEGVIISGVDPNFTAPQPQNVSDGNPSPLDEEESNGSIAQAQPLTQFFLNSPNDVNPNVEFSTRIPYVSIANKISDNDSSDSGDYYSFKVTAAGTRAISDIDTPKQGGADTSLVLLNRDGNQLESNSRASSSLGAGGSTLDPDSNDSYDPYLRHTFSEPGTYYIRVEPSNTGAYTLQVSLEAPNAATSAVNGTLPSGLFARTEGAGTGGNVMINTPQLTVTDGANISATATEKATSTARGGNIEVNSSQVNLSGNNSGLFALTQGAAPAGSLTLNPDNNGQILRVNLQDNAQISASTSGSGQGGSLSIEAPQAATISGKGQLSVETSGAGRGGNLTIETQRLTIQDRTQVSASTSSPNPEGVGGNLTINATESFNLTNQARLLAQSNSTAHAGNIKVETGQLTASNGSIETSATQSTAGTISITAADIHLFGDSDITTSVFSGAGNGGNIDLLEADSIIAFYDSDILAYAQDGKGGRINFDTPAFFGENYRPAPRNTDPVTLDDNNRVDVNANAAVRGVIITPDTTFIQNSLTELPENQINTDSLLATSCIVRRNQPTRGSFTTTGTGGLPQRPGDVQMSSFPTVDVETLPSDSTPSTTNPNRPWQKGDPIVEPQGVYRLPNGKLVLSRECS